MKTLLESSIVQNSVRIGAGLLTACFEIVAAELTRRAIARFWPEIRFVTSAATRVGAITKRVLSIMLVTGAVVAPCYAGRVVAWGNNSAGQTDVPPNLTNVMAIVAGSRHSLALKTDGTIVGWGSPSMELSVAPAGLSNVIAVAAGGSNTMALKADGTVFCWTPGWDGVSGLTNAAPDGLTNVIAISAGVSHCLVLVGDAPPQLQAAVTNLQHTGADLSLQLPTQSGRVYRLEYDTSAGGTNWAASAIVPGSGSLQTLTDSSATNTSRFYRVRRW